MTDKEKPTIDVDAMRDSWLKALSEGHAEGFSRHFVPDILDELERLASAYRAKSDALAEAERKLAVASRALSAIASSAPCVEAHESFNSPGQPCDQRIAEEAIRAISSPAPCQDCTGPGHPVCHEHPEAKPDPDGVQREAARTRKE